MDVSVAVIGLLVIAVLVAFLLAWGVGPDPGDPPVVTEDLTWSQPGRRRFLVRVPADWAADMLRLLPDLPRLWDAHPADRDKACHRIEAEPVLGVPGAWEVTAWYGRVFWAEAP